jgi:hypothetical protein
VLDLTAATYANCELLNSIKIATVEALIELYMKVVHHAFSNGRISTLSSYQFADQY